MIARDGGTSRVGDSIWDASTKGQAMRILHLDCSPRGQASESYRIAQQIIGFLQARDPAAVLVRRVLGAGAISHIDQSYATALGGKERSPAEISPSGSMSRSEELIIELESSDVVVI